MVEVRPAVENEGYAIGALRSRAWQAAYRGVLPDAMLDALPLDEERWQAIARGEAGEERLWVAFAGGKIVGYCHTGPSRDADAPEGVHPRLTRGHVLRPQPVVHRQASVQRVERLARSEREAPAPHLVRWGLRRWGGLGLRCASSHQSAAAPTAPARSVASPAPILIDRPYRRMKPSASFWL